MENVYLLITGHTGVGKQTVGEIISEMTDARLIHNQMIAAPLFEAIGVTTDKISNENWQNLVHTFHKMAHLALGVTDLAPDGTNFIVTNPMIDGDYKARALDDILQHKAEDRGGTYIPVVLDCSDEQEHMERIVSEGRDKLFKLTNPTIAKRLLQENRPYISAHPNLLRVDSAGKEPADVAKEIIDYVQKLLEYKAYTQPDEEINDHQPLL